MRYAALLALLSLLCLAAALPTTADEPVTVFIVRHAEKDTSDAANRNPGLSRDGEQRAAVLAHLLSAAKVTHLYASEYERTQATLKPLASKMKKEVQVVSARSADDQIQSLRTLQPGSVAVVAGHSNTVPALVKELGGTLEGLTEHPNYGPMLAEDEYDRLIQVILPASEGTAVKTIDLRYGRPSH